MGSEGQTGSNCHALLIGIDHYPRHELYGCVNDIDAIQRLLLGPRLGIPRERIRRLASPIPGTRHETTVDEQPATLDNLRAALAELGSDRVRSGDRVFIYYSGHGKRVLVDGEDGQFQREALVPVDFEAQGREQFLFDFELNRLLRAVAARTSSVAVMLDCCFAAGAPRDRETVRCIDRGDRDQVAIPDPARSQPSGGKPGARADRIDTCHIVAACLANEFAKEHSIDGVRHGLLTHAFVTALAADGRADLHAITWDEIWHTVRSDVMARTAAQTPRMDGHQRRRVFAGPPTDGDVGFHVSRDGAGYRIAAGTLAGLTKDAEIAIYRAEPACFPALGTPDDIAARAGIVRVTDAAPAIADAVAIGAPFDLPPGARGRIVNPGARERLRCAVSPPNAEIEAQLAASPLLELVAPGDAPAVCLRQRDGDPRWYITDDEHGTGDDAPVLFALAADEVRQARAAIEHYDRYSLPLRFARRATDLVRGLELRVLRCNRLEMPAEQAQHARLPDAPTRGKWVRVASGTPVCLSVRNLADQELHVAVFNVGATGQVELLEQTLIRPNAFHRCWDGAVGRAFVMTPLEGARWSRDRIVAIGRTARIHELDHLRVPETFDDVVRKAHEHDRPLRSRLAAAPLEQWTAAQAVIETWT